MPAPTSRSARLVLGATLALFALPPALDLLVGGARRAFGWFAADAFYYLTVARNVSERGRVSYDGTHGTNGFHPLWQYTLAAFYTVVEHLGARETTILVLVLLGNVALIAAALVLFARVLRRDDGTLTSAFVILPVGAYAVWLLPIWLVQGDRIARDAFQEGALPLYGTLWSYVNGMESAVVLLAFALLFCVYVARGALSRPSDGVAIGLCLAALTFARLDLVFVPLALLAGHGVAWLLRRGRPLWPFVALVAAFAVPLAAYMAFNKLVYGGAMPVSGSLKSSFPHLDAANWARLKLALTTPLSSPVGRTYREAQIVIPALFALAYVPVVAGVRGWRAGVGRREQLLVATGAGVVALALYDQLFVTLYFQGHWYFPLSTTYCALVVISAIDRLRPRVPAAARLAWLAVAIAASLAIFFAVVRRPGYHTRYAQFYFEQAPRMRAFYGETPPCFLEVDDGIFAFSTRFPSLSGFGLNLDPEGVRALKHDRLLPFAVARGCGRVTSVVYISPENARPGSPPSLAAHVISGVVHRDDATRFDFAVEYRDGDVLVVKVDPKRTN